MNRHAELCAVVWHHLKQWFPTFLWPCTTSAFRQMITYP